MILRLWSDHLAGLLQQPHIPEYRPASSGDCKDLYILWPNTALSPVLVPPTSREPGFQPKTQSRIGVKGKTTEVGFAFKGNQPGEEQERHKIAAGLL